MSVQRLHEWGLGQSPPAHPCIAIFEHVHPFDHRNMPWTFRDDFSNGSGVIQLTDKQTDKVTNTQTDTTGNDTSFAARVQWFHLLTTS